MLSDRDLGWLAGLVEGEGCVTLTGNRCPTLSIGMTDEDTIQRAASYLRATGKTETWQRPGEKRMYRIHVRGRKAVGWLLTLYALLGSRRRARVREVLTVWRSVPSKTSVGWDPFRSSPTGSSGGAATGRG